MLKKRTTGGEEERGREGERGGEGKGRGKREREDIHTVASECSGAGQYQLLFLLDLREWSREKRKNKNK